MTLQPLLTQLHPAVIPTAGNDCSVTSLLNAVRWASDGKVGPRNVAEQAAWTRDVRRWAGVTANRGLLFRSETFRAYQSRELAKRFVDAGLSPLRAEIAEGVGWGTLGRRIQAGQLVHLAVNYGVLHAGNAPTGSDTFKGGHSLVLAGAMREHNHLHVHDGDPLFDGRRAGVPKGWTDARLIDFRKAAGAFGLIPPGAGHADAIFVHRSV